MLRGLEVIEARHKLSADSRWTPDHPSWEDLAAERKAYFLERHQRDAEQHAIGMASLQDRAMRRDILSRHERHSLSKQAQRSKAKLISALLQVRRWVLAPGDAGVSGWGYADIDALLEQLQPSGSGMPEESNAAPVGWGVLVELPWMLAPNLVWRVEPEVDLAQRYLRCKEECGNAQQELEAMMSVYEGRVALLEGALASVQGYVAQLVSGCTGDLRDVAVRAAFRGREVYRGQDEYDQAALAEKAKEVLCGRAAVIERELGRARELLLKAQQGAQEVSRKIQGRPHSVGTTAGGLSTHTGDSSGGEDSESSSWFSAGSDSDVGR